MTLSNAPSYQTLIRILKGRIQQAQSRAALAVSRELLHVYWLTGRDITLRQSQEGWGSSVIEQLANDIRSELPEIQGFSARNMWRMRAFYQAHPETSEILPQAVAETSEPQMPSNVTPLPWGHHVTLIEKVKDTKARQWYAQAALENGWSRAILVHQIEYQQYECSGKAITNFEQTLPPTQSDLAQQLLKDPYNFDFLTLRQEVHERELERALVNDIRKFLLELGVGFSFVGSQYHLCVGDNDFYIDLLFYHLKLRCYVVIDLKIKEFKPEYAGKMNFYLSAVDDLLSHSTDEPSIGLILCKSNNKVVAEYALRDMNKPMGVATYLTEALPDNLRSSLPDIHELEEKLSVPKLDDPE